MIFPTFDFLLFALPVLLGFWLLAGRPVARSLFLLVASYFFYMAGPKTEPPPAPWYFVGLLIFSTGLDFVCGQRIYRLKDALKSKDRSTVTQAKRVRSYWLTLSLVGNLGLLGYFKYANFFIEAFSDVVGTFGWEVEAFHLDVVLPLGISFYTFQSLSYTLDIWRQKLKPEQSFLRFALFVVFFPQLVAGPIVRASQFLPQLQRGPKFSREHLEVGAFRVCRGLAKKVVLGDWVAVQLTDLVFDSPEAYSSLELTIALYAYTLQIYADFSGYSDIAIGIGKMLGFELPENFDRPYQSKDIAEYWRRWHMTLAGWLRDYLFFSLLSRLGARGGYIAVWTTMFLVGMWHGASWNFVIYANLHAWAVVFNRWKRMRRPENLWQRVGAPLLVVLTVGVALATVAFVFLDVDLASALKLGVLVTGAAAFVTWLPVAKSAFNSFLHIACTFHLLVFTRIFFRSPDLVTSGQYLDGLLNWDGAGMRQGFVSIWVWAALVFGLAYHFTPKKWVDETLLGIFRRLPGVVLGLLFSAFIWGLMRLMEGGPRAFIYFQF